MKLWPLFAISFGISSVAFGDTANFTPVADTTISENNAANPDVVPGHMIVGHLHLVNAMSRGLTRFDVSSIPSGATITSATLTVTVTMSGSDAADTHALHRVTTPWVEGTANWIHSGVDEWSFAGGDYQPAADSTTLIPAASGTFTFPTTLDLVNTVQTWVNNEALNYGWILRSESEASGRNGRRFTTREESESLPPSVLTVGFTPAPPPPTITIANARVADGKFKFDFIAAPGFAYIGQYKEALLPGDWTDFAWIPDPEAIALVTV